MLDNGDGHQAKEKQATGKLRVPASKIAGFKIDNNRYYWLPRDQNMDSCKGATQDQSHDFAGKATGLENTLQGEDGKINCISYIQCKYFPGGKEKTRNRSRVKKGTVATKKETKSERPKRAP